MAHRQDVNELAKVTLGLEDSKKGAPPHYIKALEKFLVTNPMDIHFIMELGKEGTGLGGNGFGSVTCMEDYCWEDIVLDSDPAFDIGHQRKLGLGSFFNFKVHCQVEKHVRGRNERCRKEGIPIVETKDPFANPPSNVISNSASTSAAARPWDSEGHAALHRERHEMLARLQNEEKDRKAKAAPGPSKNVKTQPTWLDDLETGPSRHRSALTTDFSSSPPRDEHFTTASHALKPLDPNAWLSRSLSASSDRDLKPFGSHMSKGKGPMITVDDSDDDDIIELKDDHVPAGMRKSNKAPPIMVHDQDVKPVIPRSSQSSQGRIDSFLSGPSRSQGSAKSESSQPKANGIMPLSKQTLRQRYEKELTHLKVAHKMFGSGPTKNDRHRNAVAQRYREIDLYITLPNTSTQYRAPSEDIMTIVPSIRALVKSFDDPSVPAPALPSQEQKPTTGPSMYDNKPFQHLPQNAIAGPSAHTTMQNPYGRNPYAPGMASYGPYGSQMLDRPGMPGAFPGMAVGPDTKPLSTGPLEYLSASARAALLAGSQAAMGLQAGIGSALTMATGLQAPVVPGMALNQMMDDEYAYRFMEDERVDNLQEFFTESLNSFDEDQDVEGALKYLEIRDLQSRFRDLSVSLMPHQVLGVKFMIEQEKKRKMKGGLLADSMGLGKTLSSIAVIAGHPSEDRKVKTTLVVAPLALLQQWKSEIESKTTSGRKVLIHWGPKRTHSPAQLKQYDVVLTTYGILTTEHGQHAKRKVKARRNDSDESDDGGIVNPVKQGPLFKVLWYRVVLDEAHMIRNKSTRAAKAAWDLNAIYRWCLTGTPVMNSLGDLYPLLHFLNISPQADWKGFHAHIAKWEKKKPRLAANRMQAILKTCSIRRNKDSTLNGVRLLNLPPKVVTWDELELTVEERHIYTSIENRMQVKFNALLKRGTVLKHYSMVLVMLVRLKQATSHPFLLTRRAEDAAHPEDVVISDEELMGTRDAALLDDMKELQRALDTMGQEYVDKVAQMLEDRWKEIQKNPDAVDSEVSTECSICFEPYEHEHAERVTECCHSFCATCMENLWNDAPRTSDLSDDQLEQNMRQCPICREPMSRDKVFRASAFFNQEEQADIKPQLEEGVASSSKDVKPTLKRASEDPEEDVKPALKKLTMAKGKGKATDYKEDVKPKPEEINFDEIDITPSTKMRHLLAVIQEKLQDPSVKVVAYSQFTSFLDLGGAYLQANGVSALQYQGSMAAGDRQKTLDKFNTPPDLEGGHHRVLLLSLKAGGVGLNLTVSNVVIALDLAWNAATEDQAVDRCHRIGQVKEVDVRRLCVKNSIDERIRDLQENKRKLADGALGEGEGGKLGRLSIGDLIRLFNVDGGGHDV